MIEGLKEEDLEVVVRISGKLGEGWSFRISNWLGGVQCNWVKGDVSMMWRSVGWDREMVEKYEEGVSKYDDVVRYYIEELEV